MSDPVLLFGHFTYFLLIVSMLMRNIVWLRCLAVGSGVTKIVYRWFFVFDPVSVFWELVFVGVNLTQLAIMWWENRRRHMTEEETRFVDGFRPRLPHAAAAALLESGRWIDADAGARLTLEGEALNALIYVSEGDVRIESGGRTVGRCGPGDFIGEMTWQSGAPATGTAVADGPVRYLRFERAALEAVLRKRAVLGFALQASFNRNLIDKLMRANAMKNAATA
ncbi:MAG: cyclic nucleotide-binding domain-containing protein [Hyphomonadaceae bacterium]|nr:cyclic nucleotide-binding domain-containing protein [Hyphomonadaceae bacterium]